MPKFRVKVTQVLRVVRQAYVEIEAPTAQDAVDLQYESDAPPNGPAWETVDSSVENESCMLAE